MTTYVLYGILAFQLLIYM